jgi:hypothetical protein
MAQKQLRLQAYCGGKTVARRLGLATYVKGVNLISTISIVRLGAIVPNKAR